jgi:hypothetical protein
MSLLLSPDLVEPFAGGLMAGIDVDGGPTDEQLGVLQAIVAHVWNRPDLDLMTVRRIEPNELADLVTDQDHRNAFHELHLTLETCRHPVTDGQVELVQAYADALGVDGEDLAIFRDLVSDGVDAASADYLRFLGRNLDERVEPSLVTMSPDADLHEAALAEKLEAFAEYGPGTLGRAFLGFYERFGLTLPGLDSSTHHHFFVAHDMTHTIAGLSTTVPAEIALSAFQFAMNNDRLNRAALLASLVAHEAGFAHPSHLAKADDSVLANPANARLLATELRRGSACRGDFSLIDHFELAPMQIADVRAEFGVVAPENPADGQHWW